MNSRTEKTSLLAGIIQNLDIGNEEKDLYFFSMEILNNENFEKFYQKVITEFHNTKKGVTFIGQ